MYLKSTSPWTFSSYKTSKGKNKDFAKLDKFFAMPMPMLIPRCRCRDFQMAYLSKETHEKLLCNALKFYLGVSSILLVTTQVMSILRILDRIKVRRKPNSKETRYDIDLTKSLDSVNLSRRTHEVIVPFHSETNLGLLHFTMTRVKLAAGGQPPSAVLYVLLCVFFFLNNICYVNSLKKIVQRHLIIVYNFSCGTLIILFLQLTSHSFKNIHFTHKNNISY